MKKNLISLLENYDFEKVSEVVDTELKAAYINAVGSTLSGWHSDLLLHEDGSVTLTGEMSCGSMTMSQYEGAAITLYTLPSSIEPNSSVVFENDVENLTDDERAKLLDYVSTRYEYDDEEAEEEHGLWDYIEDFSLDLDFLFVEVFPKKLAELQVEAIEADWDNYYRDRVIDGIQENVDTLREYLEYEE